MEENIQIISNKVAECLETLQHLVSNDFSLGQSMWLTIIWLNAKKEKQPTCIIETITK